MNLYYKIHAYLYILGLIKKPDQDKPSTLSPTYISIIEHGFKVLKDRDDMLSKCKMISNEELTGFIDLLDRYEYSRTELLKTGKTTNKVNFDAVIGQKLATNFVIYKEN